MSTRGSPQHRWIAEASGGVPEREAELLARWEAGEPLQYVLGRWAFRGMDLAVDSRALIPRPETEMLVEVALSLCRAPKRVVDLGTGAGPIALAIADECRAAEVWAVDISAEALQLAQMNDPKKTVRFVRGDWYKALPDHLRGRVDLIVSNPPYVSESEYDELEPVVRDWEPRSALVSGATGLESLGAVIWGAPRWLTKDGVLALECAPHQADAVVAECAAAGLHGAEAHADLTGRARVVTARRATRPDA